MAANLSRKLSQTKFSDLILAKVAKQPSIVARNVSQNTKFGALNLWVFK